jgi:hypothetical protein
MKSVLVFLACGVACLVCGACVLFACWQHSWELSRRDWDALLNGDRTVSIASFTLAVDDEHIVMNDPASTGYWTEVCRSASDRDYRLGATYQAKVTLSTGRSVDVGLYVPKGGDDLTVSSPLGGFGDLLYYRIRLTEPMPDSIAAALRKIRECWGASDDARERHE